MRAFLALPIDKKIAEKIHSDFSFLYKPGVKPVPPENMHITLNFFSDIKDISFIKNKMDSFDLKAFTIKLMGVSAFPSLEYIRVLYIRVEIPGFIEEQLKEFSKSIGGDSFSSLHLTFARVMKRIDVNKLFSVNTDYGEQYINKIVLYESILKKPAPIYKALYIKELPQ